MRGALSQWRWKIEGENCQGLQDLRPCLTQNLVYGDHDSLLFGFARIPEAFAEASSF